MTVLIAVTAAVASLGLILDYRQKKLGIESAAADLIIADALHPVGGAERYSARRPDAWASLRPRLPWGRSGRQISVTPSAGAADSRPDSTWPRIGPATTSHMDPCGDTSRCQPRWGAGR
jgi:hypothetical protein